MENIKCLQVEREVSFANYTPLVPERIVNHVSNDTSAHAMTQIKTYMDLRLAAVKEREGWQTEQDMRLNWSEEQILEHYNMYYKHFTSDVPEHVLKDAIMEELGDKELRAMLDRWPATDIIEIFRLEGFLTVINGHFIVSVDMFLGCNE